MIQGRSERALGYQQITTVSAAVGLTLPAGTSRARVTVSGQAVRYRDDGANPTAAVGMPLAAGSTTDFGTQQLSQLRFIEAAASATLDVSYYGL